MPTRRRFLQGLVLLPLGGLLAKLPKTVAPQEMSVTGLWEDGSREAKRFVPAKSEMCSPEHPRCRCAYQTYPIGGPCQMNAGGGWKNIGYAEFTSATSREGR